jgi:hypothetical protein
LFAESIIIYLICLLAAGLGAYALGKKEGIRGTVEYLIEEGLLEVED